MKKFKFLKITSLLLIGIVVLFSVGCRTVKTLPENVIIEQTYTVKVGEQTNIVLKSNPSTGYGWDLEEDYDKKVVAFEKEEYVADQVDSDILGAGGKVTFTFKGIKKGETYIVLKYNGPNKNITAETKTFKIIVNK